MYCLLCFLTFFPSGNPSPQVTWWKEHELMDSSYERTYTHVVQNSIKIGPLGPEMQKGVLGLTFKLINGGW